jgi:dienelactone hydrolase
MGCIVFLYDMIGYADSVPITYEVAHRFAEQRPELSGPGRWGLFSAQAELRLQNVLGLQLFNSVRALDFLSGLPDVDPDRLAVTGASGGGTQTFLLAAVDPRPAAAFPAVMVSTAMQGGCTCENASYLRIGTGNVEFAALFAPKPLGLTGANDWTRDIETKGLPELKRHYELLGAPDNVTGRYFDFGHNYNSRSRAMMYAFMADRLGLASDVSIEERDYVPLKIEEATVWDAGHPRPPTDEDAEVRLLAALDADSCSQLDALRPVDRPSFDEFRRVVGGALETMVGRPLPEEGDVTYDKKQEIDRGTYLETTALLRYEDEGEAVPAVFLYPKAYRGRVVIWIDEQGKSALYDGDGSPINLVTRLMDQGICVVGCDLLHQGEATSSEEPLTRSRSVENPREFLGFTAGYNHPLFAQRVHDILSVLSFIRHHDFSPGRVEILAPGGAGRWAAAACAVAGQAVDALAVGTDGFRFGRITEIRDPDLWPGAVKYGDLPALLALCAPTPLWLSREGPEVPDLVRSAYGSTEAPAPESFEGDGPRAVEAAVGWLLDRA